MFEDPPAADPIVSIPMRERTVLAVEGLWLKTNRKAERDSTKTGEGIVVLVDARV